MPSPKLWTHADCEAAGIGKTTELVNRILLFATGRSRMIEIVAVTFTEKAAGEPARLREALEHKRSRGACEQVRQRLANALETLEEAHFNTIHGFCAELLRERPVEACVDPLFAVLTEPQAERTYGRAFRAWLQEAMQNPPEGLRRALRRTSAPAFQGSSGDSDGPTTGCAAQAACSRSGATFHSRGAARRSTAPGKSAT